VKYIHLPSGRIFILGDELTAAEEEACKTPEGYAMLEELADQMQARNRAKVPGTRTVIETDPEYQRLLKDLGGGSN
jgi:hypothetical protein